ncbi:diguanylate cyclase [Nakamurella antarctica]|uniref:Diguanylate cyclase n=1 Tax=Nakamurella antarctica TaxID=1902245 RepID=A0A3G8ZJZ6_9ACTN|nr:diguanylate cyclase [Nakamurella antarctica]AZI57107.1 diguanylate cyclase [Nakamurella antarctica]
MIAISARLELRRAILQWCAAALACVYLIAIAARLFWLNMSHTTVTALLAGVSALALGSLFWYVVAHQRTANVEVVAVVLVLIPAADSLLGILLTREITETAILLLVILGAGAVTTTLRSMSTVAGSTVALWAVVVFVGNLGQGSERLNYALLMVGAAGMSFLIFLIRAGAERDLVAAASQAQLQVARLEAAATANAEAERRYRKIFMGSPVAMALADENGHFIEVNPALCALLARDRIELIGRSSRPFTHLDDLPIHHSMSDRMRDAGDGGVVRVEKRYVRPSGEIRWAWLSISAARGPRGQTWTLMHAEDVTDRKETEEALRRSQLIVASAGHIARNVQSGKDMHAVIVAAVQHVSGADIVLLLEPADGGDFRVAGNIGIEPAQKVLSPPCSHLRKTWANGQPAFANRPTADESVSAPWTLYPQLQTILWEPIVDQGTVISLMMVGFCRRIERLDDWSVTAARGLSAEAASALTATRMRLELEVMAQTDPLTGLANRRGWTLRLQELAARVPRVEVTIGLIDFDNFKKYNDTFGHEQGDLLLQDFARRARACLRSEDVIARWGGEEFVVALSAAEGRSEVAVFQQLRAAMSDGQTCSIGYAQMGVDETPAHCVRRADETLYLAKRSGRDQVVGAELLPARST